MTKTLSAKNDEMMDIRDTLDMIIIPEWHKDAACRGHANPDLWFPEPGDSRMQTAWALWICAHCPVRGECLDDAIRKNEKHGIRGGRTTRQRVRMMRRRMVRS